MKYLQVFVDFVEDLEALSDAECGRLFKAMLRYAANGELTEFKGNERFLWAGARKTIDRQRESYHNKVAGAEQARKAKIKNSDSMLIGVDIKSHQEPSSRLALISSQDKDKDKDKDKNKDNKTICAKQASPSLISLPLVDKTEFGVTEADVSLWTSSFPNADVMQELRKMRAWLEANPTRKKTRNGIKRFIVAWLGRVQDSGKPVVTKQKTNKYAEIYEKY